MCIFLSVEGFIIGTFAILTGCLAFMTIIKYRIIDDWKHYVLDIEIKDKENEDESENSK